MKRKDVTKTFMMISNLVNIWSSWFIWKDFSASWAKPVNNLCTRSHWKKSNSKKLLAAFVFKIPNAGLSVYWQRRHYWVHRSQGNHDNSPEISLTLSDLMSALVTPSSELDWKYYFLYKNAASSLHVFGYCLRKLLFFRGVFIINH